MVTCDRSLTINRSTVNVIIASIASTTQQLCVVLACFIHRRFAANHVNINSNTTVGKYCHGRLWMVRTEVVKCSPFTHDWQIFWWLGKVKWCPRGPDKCLGMPGCSYICGFIFIFIANLKCWIKVAHLKIRKCIIFMQSIYLNFKLKLTTVFLWLLTLCK